MTVSVIDPRDLCLPPRLLAAFQQSSDCAVLAVVGGAVRDLLLHRVHLDPLRGLPDLDLVVELDPQADPADPRPAAHRLAETLLREAPAAAVGFCQFHRSFGTVELEVDGILLDLASARSETYPAPGENPIVSYGSLEDDLARRDFSINAMALVFDLPGSGLRLLDPHGGGVDLAHRQLRLLHDRSLEDDPTRIVRAARYAARLGFSLAPASLEQLHTTLARWPWGERSGIGGAGRVPPALGTRLRMELELLLEREPWPEAMASLQAWGALVLVDPALQADVSWRLRLRWARRSGLPSLAALLAVSEVATTVATRLQLPHGQLRLLAQLALLRQAWRTCGAVPRTALAWSTFLEQPGWSPEAVALALVSGALPRRPLLRWWCRWRHLSSPVPAADLIASGLRPGPALGERLRQLRGERLQLERT
ncbi:MULTISPECIES: CCA tRNA nucleotidyltransferase [unclassified Cyanobium]|uniref:CCA tRNA nucleotidyltransferase n=1 Tax=unclassified Cyanobium TaxID=2627006 RepID=UPI0020CB820F|nr:MULTISPECIES: CCA tRNA nucleotidyltransferase [unclassified Cyanobium]MCP9834049.1 CCA tRNA nucleotidyltransferase [Cyanobium sp. La Preciosa 7G6]MCP9936812.1 CCA tRNA nucleotidyltransferase [Cyanobium sp. Aljojuca 7A6]